MASVWPLCGKGLAPLVRTSIPQIRVHRFIEATEEVCEAPMHISAATIDRLLKEHKVMRLKARSHTRATGGLGPDTDTYLRAIGPEWPTVTCRWTPWITTPDSALPSAPFLLVSLIFASAGGSEGDCRTELLDGLCRPLRSVHQLRRQPLLPPQSHGALSQPV